MRIRTFYKLAGIGALLTSATGMTAAIGGAATMADYVNNLYAATSGLTPEQARQVSFVKKLTRMPKEPGKDPGINFMKV